MDIKSIIAQRPIRTLANAKKAAGSQSKTFEIEAESQLTDVPSVVAQQSPYAVDGLFLLIDQPSSAQQQATNRAHIMLDYLEQLRVGLIIGSVSRSDLHQLGVLLKHCQDQNIDPQLKEVILEVEARAQVEIAKLENL